MLYLLIKYFPVHILQFVTTNILDFLYKAEPDIKQLHFFLTAQNLYLWSDERIAEDCSVNVPSGEKQNFLPRRNNQAFVAKTK